MKNTKKNISIEKLHPFENHPYKVQDNEEMDALAESIKAHGVVSPIIIRPLEKHGFILKVNEPGFLCLRINPCALVGTIDVGRALRHDNLLLIRTVYILRTQY